MKKTIEFEIYPNGTEVFFLRHDAVQTGYIKTASITVYETGANIIYYELMYCDGEDNVIITMPAGKLFYLRIDLINSL